MAAIADQQEGLTSRSMGYDGLDRLTSDSGIWGAGNYGYDARRQSDATAIHPSVQQHRLRKVVRGGHVELLA